jgi:hypothetical protein
LLVPLLSIQRTLENAVVKSIELFFVLMAEILVHRDEHPRERYPIDDTICFKALLHKAMIAFFIQLRATFFGFDPNHIEIHREG